MTMVTASIVLHDSGPIITACLAALDRQTVAPDRVLIIDNASVDGGEALAAAAMPSAEIVRLPENIGFAGAHDLVFERAPADVHLVLNPDCRLAPDFLAKALATLAEDPAIGSVSGRLLRFRDAADGGPLVELPDDILDSTGMVAFRNRRVLDRGADTPAAGAYLEPEDVFGVTGAAAVYRRAMLDDVAYRGEIFDRSFFAFREDVDLAWRALLLGWRCRYVPTALARHRRRVTPERRRELPASINRRSVANRWRMLARNETRAGWRRDGVRILARDAQIVGYAALREQRTLGAVMDVLRDARRLRAWRRDLMRRRVTDPAEMLAWFDGDPRDGTRGAGGATGGSGGGTGAR